MIATLIYVIGMIATAEVIERRHGNEWSKNGMTAAATLWPLYWACRRH